MSEYYTADEYGMAEMLSFPAASYGSDLISTGYLEDVLFQFSSNSKRRRPLDDADYAIPSPQFVASTTKDRSYSDMKTPEDETYYDSPKECAGNHQWAPEKENLHPIFSLGDEGRKKKRLLANVVYPFAVVKPGGFEGGATLNDINERILMPPTRPVRHPVGEFACRPLASRDGVGLSGKVVVAFTRIQTQGKGTITIVRTRG